MYKWLIFLIITAITSHLYGENTHLEIEQYVDQLVTKASDLLNDQTLMANNRTTQSSELISANLDLEWMAMHTLGRHKKTLNSRQLSEFSEAYAQYVIKIYSDLVKNYRGEKAKIKKVYPLNENKQEFIVNTEIIKNHGQPPVKVNYFVRRSISSTSKLKISDIITEGVSMVNSQKAEFSSIISNNGFENLVTNLRKKSLNMN